MEGINIEAKRDAVLSLLYDDMSGILDEEERKNVAEAIKIIESARNAENEHELKKRVATDELVLKNVESDLAERELKLKEEKFLLEDRIANQEAESKRIEQEQKERELSLREKQILLDERIANQESDAQKRREENERKAMIFDAIIKIGTTVLWGALFAHEMHATRLFEEKGTEVSNASRWLKQAFPKVRLI